MIKKLVFDTLEYATMLEEGGIENADIHSKALAEALTENFYTIHETDHMFAQSLKQFKEDNEQIRKEFQVSLHEMKQDFHRMELEIKEIGNQTVHKMTRNIGLMITLFTLIEILLHTKLLGYI